MYKYINYSFYDIVCSFTFGFYIYIFLQDIYIDIKILNKNYNFKYEPNILFLSILSIIFFIKKIYYFYIFLVILYLFILFIFEEIYKHIQISFNTLIIN